MNFIKIGVGTLLVLGIIYAGNLVMKTTPSGVADGPYQYKIVSLQLTEAETKEMRPTMEKMSYDEKKSFELASMEKKINDIAKDGWEYVQAIGDTEVVFRKK